MKLGLTLNDPEEEHDCFSDNTHNSHYYDVVRINAVYRGGYKRVNGRMVKGPGLSAVVAKASPQLNAEMRAKLDKTLAAMKAIKDRAESKEAYDQMIGADNPEGSTVVQAAIEAIEALMDQTRTIERIVTALKLKSIKLERSDSLDNPSKIKNP